MVVCFMETRQYTKCLLSVLDIILSTPALSGVECLSKVSYQVKSAQSS